MMIVLVLFVFGLILGSPHGFQVLDQTQRGESSDGGSQKCYLFGQTAHNNKDRVMTQGQPIEFGNKNPNKKMKHRSKDFWITEPSKPRHATSPEQNSMGISPAFSYALQLYTVPHATSFRARDAETRELDRNDLGAILASRPRSRKCRCAATSEPIFAGVGSDESPGPKFKRHVFLDSIGARGPKTRKFLFGNFRGDVGSRPETGNFLSTWQFGQDAMMDILQRSYQPQLLIRGNFVQNLECVTKYHPQQLINPRTKFNLRALTLTNLALVWARLVTTQCLPDIHTHSPAQERLRTESSDSHTMELLRSQVVFNLDSWYCTLSIGHAKTWGVPGPSPLLHGGSSGCGDKPIGLLQGNDLGLVCYEQTLKTESYQLPAENLLAM